MSHRTRRRRTSGPSIVASFIVIVVLVWSFVPGKAQSAPSFLLITIDTLRADRLGSYGYGRARTPALDDLASRGVRFSDATVHAVLTHPSHAAILTGRYPGAFGIRLNGMDPLPSTAVTLAERLKMRDYRTGAVVSSVILSRSHGLAQGFDDYDDAMSGPPSATVALSDLQRAAGVTTGRAVSWIAGQRAPWFLWVHYYDPHLPYSAPAKFAAAATGRPYDAEVSYVDSEIARLLKSVDQAKTVIVATSDHGEALGEHGEEDHGFFLYESTLRVPLIVAGAGITPRVVDEQVRSIDIAPTVLDFAGIDSPRTPDGGESLRPLMEGRARSDVPPSIAESWYPRLHFGWSELRSIRVGEWKFIAAPKAELYDLRKDRAESANVVNDRPQVAARLASDLQRVTASVTRPESAGRQPQPDAATVERLQALGYVGSFAPVMATAASEDPKDRIADYRAYRQSFNQALELLSLERPAAAVPILQRLVKANVRAFEGHLYLGNAYAMQAQHDAALGEYDAASQLNPDLATPHLEAAKVLARTGRADAAVARANRGLALDPDSFYGHYTLGVIHQRASQWQQAFTAFGRAVELNGSEPRARANLASAAMRLDRLDVARAQFEAMIALDHQVAPAHYNLGVIAARRGDRAEAARQYRLALRADPGFKPARDALARLK